MTELLRPTYGYSLLAPPPCIIENKDFRKVNGITINEKMPAQNGVMTIGAFSPHAAAWSLLVFATWDSKP